MLVSNEWQAAGLIPRGYFSAFNRLGVSLEMLVNAYSSCIVPCRDMHL